MRGKKVLKNRIRTNNKLDVFILLNIIVNHAVLPNFTDIPQRFNQAEKNNISKKEQKRLQKKQEKHRLRENSHKEHVTQKENKEKQYNEIVKHLDATAKKVTPTPKNFKLYNEKKRVWMERTWFSKNYL